MFELKIGMDIMDNLGYIEKIDKVDIDKKRVWYKTSYCNFEDINWEGTAKLNGIDLKEELWNSKVGDIIDIPREKLEEILYGKDSKDNEVDSVKLNEDSLKRHSSKTMEREDTQILNLKKIEIKKLNEKVKIAKENMNKEYAHKHDKGKLQWNLLPINEVEEIVKVFDYGLQKYGKRNCWQLVENPKIRYENALYRHFAEYLKGNKFDEESGLSHLSHLVTNGLFLMWFENNKAD